MKWTAPLLLALAAMPLSACMTYSDSPNVEGSVAPEGTLVPLGQPVAVGDLVLTPMTIEEDSRCPINARCIWAGRLIVKTRVDGPGWRETVDAELGETATARGYRFALVTGEPGKTTGHETQPEQYRLGYEAR